MSDVVIPTHGFHLEPLLLVKVIIASVAFGLASALFSETVHFFQAFYKAICPWAWLRPAIGGVLIIGLTYALGTREYLGIGIWSPDPHDVTIPNLFRADNIHYWAWWWKLLFTAVTLACGFKGGEVTPLFFIGAGLGNALSSLLGAPTDLFAALGFVAIFAGASNTPLACTLMGIELFGAGQSVYIATACFLAYLSSGHSGIYLSQRLAVPKMGDGELPPDTSLRQVRELQPSALHDAIGGLRGHLAAALHPAPNLTEEAIMPHRHKIMPKEIGMVRIYLTPRESRKVRGLKGWLSRPPLYRELVNTAKEDGIINAIAHHTHYGYSKGGKIRGENPEMTNPDLTMCVELIGQREQLELFCRRHGDMLKGKVIIYKHLEHWEVESNDLETHDATIKELKSSAT